MQERIEKLVLVGAISAILATISTIAVITISFLMTYKLSSADIESYLLMINENSTLSLLEIIFGITSGIFIIPAAIGFFFFLREKINPKEAKIIFISSIGLILGSCLLIVLNSLKIDITANIAPDFAAAVEPEKTEILNQYGKLTLTLNIIKTIVYLLTYTVGAGIYGLYITQIKELQGTIGWTGIASGIFALGVFGVFLNNIFGSVLNFAAQIGSIMFFFWMISLAYAILFLYKEGKKNIDENKG